jgi:hypothetical protein
MLEHRVRPWWDFNLHQLRWIFAKSSDFHTADIFEVTLIVEGTAHPHRHAVESTGNRTEVGHEALPLRRDFDRRFPITVLGEADHAHSFALGHDGRFEIDLCPRFHRLLRL